MPRLTALSAIAVLSLALVACQRDVPQVEAPAAAAPAPAVDQQDEQGPPANAPGTNVPEIVDGVVGFDGFGPATFGSDAEQVRMAWGNDLGDAAPSEPGGCYFLRPHALGTAGYDMGFMIEGDRFVRIDVANPGYTAPGGGRIGMTRAELEQLYTGRIDASPHKYVAGAHTLRVPGPDGERAAVFETDTAGTVAAWRIGVTPQVDYVERCG